MEMFLVVFGSHLLNACVALPIIHMPPSVCFHYSEMSHIQKDPHIYHVTAIGN